MSTLIGFIFGMMAMFNFASTAWKYPGLPRWFYITDAAVAFILLAMAYLATWEPS